MPTYELKCEDCEQTVEVVCRYEERPRRCEKCGGELVQVFHAPAIAFKGSGFHCNDYD
jgi:putative FmdB family regulatory protein